jgi:hypothetical protein
MNRQNMWWLVVSIGLIVLFLGACGGAEPLEENVLRAPEENRLATYREEELGNFSHSWVAYIIQPEEDDEDQALYVELNGDRLGPYDDLSPVFEISPDGRHMAFAALYEGNWHIIVDGEDKWSHEGLGWLSYTWTSTLEGESFMPQVGAAMLQFSESGDHLAYLIQDGEGWAVVVDGESGPAFGDVSASINFVGEEVAYQAWTADGDEPVFVYGSEVLGPYSEMLKAVHAPGGDHFVFSAVRQDHPILVVDGHEQDLSDEVGRYDIGSSGELAYSYRSNGTWIVHFDDRDIPGEYDEIPFLTISPDGKHVAFWGRQGNVWSVVTDTTSYPGFDGWWYYRIGSEDYALMWGPESENLAYFARRDDSPILALNGDVLPSVEMPGLALSYYADDQGNTVGLALTGGPQLDRRAFVQCLAQGEDSGCDPIESGLVGGELAYAEASHMVIGSEREGPSSRNRRRVNGPGLRSNLSATVCR